MKSFLFAVVLAFIPVAANGQSYQEQAYSLMWSNFDVSTSLHDEHAYQMDRLADLGSWLSPLANAIAAQFPYEPEHSFWVDEWGEVMTACIQAFSTLNNAGNDSSIPGELYIAGVLHAYGVSNYNDGGYGMQYYENAYMAFSEELTHLVTANYGIAAAESKIDEGFDQVQFLGGVLGWW